MTLIGRIFRQCLLATAFASLTAMGALTQLSASKGEVSDLLTVNNTDVYAATQGGGIYKSSDAGATWSRLSGLPTNVRYVTKLAGTDPQTSASAVVYAASTAGVYKTSNGGSTWSAIYSQQANSVAVDPNNNNNVLIGVKGLGILRSTNGGTSWTLATGYDSADVNAIVFQDSANAWAGLDSNQTGGWGGVFKSTDGGATWAAPSQGQPANKFIKAIALDSSNNVYVGTFNTAATAGGVYKSSGGTGSWTIMPTGGMNGTGGAPYNLSGILALHKDKAVAGRMWAGSGPYSYTFWRLDSGTWVYGNQDQDKFSIVNALATFSGTPDRLLVAIRGVGVYVSTNASAGFPGITLAASNTGLTADRVNALAIPSSGASTIYMGLTGGSVQRSTDSGSTWTTMRGNFDTISGTGGVGGSSAVSAGYDQIFSVIMLAASPTSPNNIYAGVLGRGLYQFNGTVWGPVVSAGLDNSPTQPVSSNIRARALFVEADNSVYYSIFEKPDGDGNSANDNAGFYRFNGSSWSRVLAGPWPNNTGAGKLVKAGTTYFALINDDQPYRSTDGTTFTKMSVAHVGFARLYFTDLAPSPTTPSTFVATTNKGVFLSADSGTSWAPVTIATAAPTMNFKAIAYSSSGTLFGGTVDGRIYCSNDNGASYTAKTLPAAWAYSAITGIVRSGTTLYFLTDGNGAWQESSPSCP